MDFIGELKLYGGVEKHQLINHLKNDLRIIKIDEEKIDNPDLLLDTMNLVEIFYSKKGSGRIKEEVVRSVLDRFSEQFLNRMIPFFIQKNLLKSKTVSRKLLNYFKKKKFQRKLRRIL